MNNMPFNSLIINGTSSGISRILLATTATTAINSQLLHRLLPTQLPGGALFPPGPGPAANNPLMMNMLGLANMSLIERFQWLIEPPDNVIPLEKTEQSEARRYFVYGMIGLICHITVVNLCAVMTLTYGIVRHSTSWAIRLICERRRIRTLMPKSQNSLGLNRFDNRRGVVVSQRINSSNINNSAVRIDCSTYPYLLSLAISDLLIGIAIAPLQLDLFIHNVMCDFWRALDIFFCTSSAMHTAAIAVDRWWSITCENTGLAAPSPNSNRNSRLPPTVRLQRTLLTFLWILSAMVSVPVMYLWQIESPERISGNSNKVETCEPVADNTYLLLSTMVSFFLPLTLTIAFYVQIAMLIRSRWTLLKRRTVIEFSSILTSMMMFGNNLAAPSTHTAHPTISCNIPPNLMNGGFFEDNAPSITKAVNTITARSGSQSIGGDDKISNIARTMNYLKHIRNLIRAMSIVVLMYVLCWLPLYATLLFKAVCRCIDDSEWQRFVGAFTWLGYANSGLNPIIYFLTLEEYRVLSLSLFRLIGERVASLPRIIFRTCWWVSDKRIRSIVKLTDFFISAEATTVKSSLPLKLVKGPTVSSQLSSKRRFWFKRRSTSLNRSNSTVSINNENNNENKYDQIDEEKAITTPNSENNNRQLIYRQSLSLDGIMAAAAGDHQYLRFSKSCQPINSDTRQSIYDEICTNNLNPPVNKSKQENEPAMTVEHARLVQLPLYYDQWGRPINYNAVEANV